jgi:hypothetical protein
MQQQLMQPNLFSMIGEDPKAAMDGMFEAAHQSIKIVRSLCCTCCVAALTLFLAGVHQVL